MRNVCADSTFLIDLYDETEPKHVDANRYFDDIFDYAPNKLIVPWPILYETISTRMARNKNRIVRINKDFEILNKKNKLVLISDEIYKVPAMELCSYECKKEIGHYRPLSLVDRVIRGLISDVNIKVDWLISRNRRDFIDVWKDPIRILDY